MAPIMVLMRWYPWRLFWWAVFLAAFSLGILLICKKRMPLTDAIIRALFGGYLAFVLILTVLCRFRVDYYRYELGIFTDVVRFIKERDFAIILDDLYNVLLFIPVGFLLPMIRTDITWFSTVSFGGITSCIIEFLQFFTRTGYFQPLDMITNSVGTAVGFFLCWLVRLICFAREGGPQLDQKNNHESIRWKEIPLKKGENE